MPWLCTELHGPLPSEFQPLYSQSSRLNGKRAQRWWTVWWAQEPWATFEAADAPIFWVGKAFPTKGFPEEKLPRAVRKWTLLGRPVAYIKVALSNVNMFLLYIKGWREGKKRLCKRCDGWTSRRVNKVIMRDMRRDACGFLCLAEKATLYPQRHVSSSPLPYRPCHRRPRTEARWEFRQP